MRLSVAMASFPAKPLSGANEIGVADHVPGSLLLPVVASPFRHSLRFRQIGIEIELVEGELRVELRPRIGEGERQIAL